MAADLERRAYRLKASVLAGGMLLAGSCNTIFLKFQGRQTFICTQDYVCEPCTQDPASPNPDCKNFEQPVFQTFLMFAGEFLCILVYALTMYIGQRRGTLEKQDMSGLVGMKKFLFVLPTMCDLVATTLMNLGLFYIAASVYQMLRGAVVVFTGVLSVIFLKRKQYAFHWVGMVLVVLGVMAVGLTSIFSGTPAASEDPTLGIILVLSAQVFTATQFVVEEKVLGKYSVPPLEAVGMEGVFGLSILAILMPILYYSTRGANEVGFIFDVRYAFQLFLEAPAITASSILSICSVAFFNFSGVSVTKLISATSRTTIDACRTLLVWIVTVSLGWEIFDPYQLIGFAVLVFGTFLYNEVFHLSFIPFLRPPLAADESNEEVQPLLNPADGVQSSIALSASPIS